MTVRREGFVLIVAFLALMLLVLFLVFTFQMGNPLELAVRLFALYGFLMLSIAAIMTPFLKEIRRIFGQSFIKIHHIFAVLGLAFATAHPVSFAIQTMSFLVFLPRFDSWYIFWSLAGRPAIYILYFASIIVLLRKRIQVYWRPMHALMYVVLFFVIIHGNLIGTDFQNLAISIICNLLFAVALVAFVLKRIQRAQLKRRDQK